MTDAPIYARFILIDSGMRITPCILCSPNRRRLYIIIILDLALATPCVLPVGPSACKSLSRISIPSGLYTYIFPVFIGFIVLYFGIICFVNSSVIQPYCILLQWVLISSQKKNSSKKYLFPVKFLCIIIPRYYCSLQKWKSNCRGWEKEQY